MASSFGNYFDMDKMTSMVNKVKNAVMNYTEYEAKVRDATNNEPCKATLSLVIPAYIVQISNIVMTKTEFGV